MHPIQERYAPQIEELARAANRLAEIGFVTSHGGNLSLRVDDGVLITPTKLAKLAIRFGDICAVDMDGNVLYAAEGRKPTGEWPFHVRIMNRRPDVRGIVHAHPPVLTGFAIAGGDWLRMPFLPEPVTEVGPMIMVPYAVPLSDRLAEHFDAVIDKSNGFLMENHGAVMVSPEGIWRALELLESFVPRDEIITMLDNAAGMEITFSKYPNNAEFISCIFGYISNYFIVSVI